MVKKPLEIMEDYPLSLTGRGFKASSKALKYWNLPVNTLEDRHFNLFFSHL